LQAAKACEIAWAGVDLVWWQEQWWVVEINSSPGYNGHLAIEGVGFVERVAPLLDAAIRQA
jgi:D-alanine-D-alanine ligase-like ATP-grasp enzyme